MTATISPSSPPAIVISAAWPAAPQATQVDASTIGLVIGAASMKAMPADGWTPRSISRRATGTYPH